jgi:acetylornithine deacetylase/succinyl-diaminopimelate desuccinylase-like protein
MLVKMMKNRGISNARLLYGNANAIPAVFGEINVPNATKTIIFYAHYDGQPVNPDKWAKGLSPFTPQLATAPIDKGGTFIDLPKPTEPLNMDARLYARASADDKAGVFSIIAAYEALQKSGMLPTVNIKFFFEGEEEKGWC